jgi:hypothetical protein
MSSVAIASYICTILSMVLFAVFNYVCIKKYGLLSCYSAYGREWANYTKEHPKLTGLNIWSVVTIVTAVLLLVPMIASGKDSPLQFLCFFAPLHLFLVALTPKYNENPKWNVVHQIGAWGSVVCILLWLFLVVKMWAVIIPVFALAFVIAIGTRTLKQSAEYYLEMAMFLSTYLVLLFGVSYV